MDQKFRKTIDEMNVRIGQIFAGSLSFIIAVSILKHNYVTTVPRTIIGIIIGLLVAGLVQKLFGKKSS